MITISNSEIAKWQRCRRSWFLQYFLGVIPAEEAPANVRMQGTRIHASLQGLYGYQLDPLVVLHMLYQLEARKHPDWDAELRAELDVSLAMVEGYLEWVAETGADADLEVVGTEMDVTVPLPGLEGVSLRAQMDQVYRQLSTGLLGFLDFKTGDLEKHEYLDLDPQFRTYSLIQQLAAGHGIPTPGNEKRPDRPLVDGGMISSLRRVKRTSRSKPPYYQRDFFRYTPEQLQATYRRVLSVCRQIVLARHELGQIYSDGQPDLEALNRWQQENLPPTPMVHDCKWSCPFASGLCGMLDDGSNWPAMIAGGSRFTQGDPYAYYRRDALRTIREELAAL
jgi:hypothetical protein